MYGPFEDSLDALLNPTFLNHSSSNMDLVNPSKDQKTAMGKRFFTNSRVYRYGKASESFATAGMTAYMNINTFNVSSIAGSNAYGCIVLRPMTANRYGVFCMVAGGAGGGGGGSDDYNLLNNRPIYNLSPDDVKAAYTNAPVTYRVGDLARVFGVASVGGITINTSSMCVYCEIDNTTPTTPRAMPAWGRVYIDTHEQNDNIDPFTIASAYVDGRSLIDPDEETRSYDGRLLHDVVSDARRYGWVWKHEYDGPITDYEVNPPNIILPDPGNLGRKNGKRS